MNILILGTASAPSKYLISAIENKGHTWQYFNPRNLYLYVSEHESGHDRLYYGNPEKDEPERIYVKNFDAVICRIGTGLDYGASILMHLTENLGIYSPQTADGLLTASNKMKTTQKLSSAGVRVPRTVMAKDPIHADFLIKKIGGLPAVAKLLKGSQGVGVMILNDAEQTNMMLESFAKLEADIQIQAYVEGGGKDVRAIVVGDDVIVAMQRTGKKDFRANLAKGGQGTKIELTEEEKTMCVKMSKAVGLEFSGVDFIRGNDGLSYGIEVNTNMGLKIIDITGVNFFNALIEHIEAKTGGSEKKPTETSLTATITNNEVIELYLNTLPMSLKWGYTSNNFDKRELLETALNWYENECL